ncbi:MAG: ribosomal protein S18-alanine N-acetyltransferase [Clostridiales bacterium]|nr:ribosomal protein S18-alanine N-acetyltransferase [Clostridiales bacterium]
MNITIARMEPLHIKQAMNIENSSFSSPWTEKMFSDELKNPLSIYMGAFSGSTLLGYAGMQCVLDEGYIGNIAVDPTFRRQGIASALLNKLESEARDMCLSFITLEVRESNTGARALYESRGYEYTGRRRGYYERPSEDALLMTKFFSAGE